MNERLAVLLLAGIWACHSAAATDFSGHLKYQFNGASYPAESLQRDSLGESSELHSGDLRLKLQGSRGAWSAQGDYQLLFLHGDGVEPDGSLGALTRSLVINDKRRLFNLTDTLSEGQRHRTVQRLDRLHLDYRSASTVLRLGRQVLSWGNGLYYNPLDFFNPFDPAAIDKEYKTGDDMAYGQYLFENGSDLQGVWVVRRNAAGKLDDGVNSTALKYHGFHYLGETALEYDLLLAEHYHRALLGFGFSADLGGALWRLDGSATESDGKTVHSAVAGLSYSWVQWGKNVSGNVELFHNGFGISGGDYGPAKLAQHPDLLRRVERGELYTLGKNYLAAGATIEVTPLLLVSPNLFFNLNDHSRLWQLVATYNRWQNVQLTAALGWPVGSKGSEYGGIATAASGRYLSLRRTIFLQAAWYF